MANNINDFKTYEGVDVEKFNGQKVKIQEILVEDEKEFEYNGEKKVSKKFVVMTEPVSQDPEIRVREWFNMSRKDDSWVIPTNSGSNAGKLLAYFNVEHPSELLGKEVQVILRVGKDDRKFLGFHYG